MNSLIKIEIRTIIIEKFVKHEVLFVYYTNHRQRHYNKLAFTIYNSQIMYSKNKNFPIMPRSR